MTAQSGEALLYKEKNYSIRARPLETYFERHPPRPMFVPETSMNWVGYYASWEISEGHLYLIGLIGKVCIRPPEKGVEKSSWCQVGHSGSCTLKEIGLKYLFSSANGKVFADWYTNEIRIPHGEMIEYVHAGWASKFERYLMINIVSGIITGTHIIGSDVYEQEQNSDRSIPPECEKIWWQFWKYI